jgi:protein-L-isoaspartate(D-aspartate) O-methyltransferase
MNDAGAGRRDERAAERRRMVDEQLASRGIRDLRVLAAMAEVPRHMFVEPGLEPRAYLDCALPSAAGQTISQPWIVARMLELCALEPSHRVLEVGTGTGYQTAILAKLAGEVYSIEHLAPLFEAARARLDSLGVRNAHLRLGDGTLGWQEFEPYARVLAAAAAPHVPRALLDQLGDGGVLVIPVGSARSQRLELWRRQGNRFLRERYDECRFVPLIGQDAWRENPHHN